MKICGIYVITNKINSKRYVGQSKDIEDRWNGHKNLLRKNKHDNRHLQWAWNKYGEENFEFSKLEECEPVRKILKNREQFWMDILEVYNPEKGYNQRPAAENNLGFKHTEEGRKKISKANKGRKLSIDTKRKISESRKGKKLSEETKKKLSEKNTGKTLSEKTRKKISETSKGRKRSEETKTKMSQAHKGKSRPKHSHEHIQNVINSRKRNAKPLSEESRKRMSEAKKGKKQSQEHIQKRLDTIKRNIELKKNQEKID